MIKVLIQQEGIAILNAYAPNNRAAIYAKPMQIELKGKIDKFTIIVEEFNTPYEEFIEQRKNQQGYIRTKQHHQQQDLINICRKFHPMTAECIPFQVYMGHITKWTKSWIVKQTLTR